MTPWDKHSPQQVIFPLIPQVCDLERLKQGGEHWQWSPETPLYLGVLPRHGAKSTDVKVAALIASISYSQV